MKELEDQGVKTFMITGDNLLTAQRIARETGIASERVFAGVRPEQKAGLVKQLQDKGEKVAFVGDGINDAPALEQADLGIAVSRASDVAREAADIILLKSEIEAVPESLGLARATLRTIKQNLFWAFFYNCVGVPLAALGFMSPVLCAAAMGFSDLIVIGNALRLRSWSYDGTKDLAVTDFSTKIDGCRYLATMNSTAVESVPDAQGHFGPYGGRYVPETLMHPLAGIGGGICALTKRSRVSTGISVLPQGILQAVPPPFISPSG